MVGMLLVISKSVPTPVSKVFKPKTGSATSCELCNASHQAPAPTSVAYVFIHIQVTSSHQVTIKLRITQISSIFCKFRFIVSLFLYLGLPNTQLRDKKRLRSVSRQAPILINKKSIKIRVHFTGRLPKPSNHGPALRAVCSKS